MNEVFHIHYIYRRGFIEICGTNLMYKSKNFTPHIKIS